MIPQHQPNRQDLDDLILTSSPRFDDAETRRTLWLGQDAPLVPGDGRILLLYCPICTMPWLRIGRSQAYPRLSWEQVQRMARWLHADVDRHQERAALPEACCTVCSAAALGGIVQIEEYPAVTLTTLPGGYRFTWEGLDGSLLLCLISRGHRSTAELLQAEPDVLSTPRRAMYDVLAWLGSSSIPASLESGALHPRLSTQERTALAHRLHPGSVKLRKRWDTPRVWRGCATWQTCPPLGGHRSLLVLATALLPWLPWDPALLFKEWRRLAGVLSTWV